MRTRWTCTASIGILSSSRTGAPKASSRRCTRAILASTVAACSSGSGVSVPPSTARRTTISFCASSNRRRGSRTFPTSCITGGAIRHPRRPARRTSRPGPMSPRRERFRKPSIGVESPLAFQASRALTVSTRSGSMDVQHKRPASSFRHVTSPGSSIAACSRCSSGPRATTSR